LPKKAGLPDPLTIVREMDVNQIDRNPESKNDASTALRSAYAREMRHAFRKAGMRASG
jgi:hypothetical protein